VLSSTLQGFRFPFLRFFVFSDSLGSFPVSNPHPSIFRGFLYGRQGEPPSERCRLSSARLSQPRCCERFWMCAKPTNICIVLLLRVFSSFAFLTPSGPTGGLEVWLDLPSTPDFLPRSQDSRGGIISVQFSPSFFSALSISVGETGRPLHFGLVLQFPCFR